MGRGIWGAVNSFAGGMASGLATGTRMRSEMEQAERERVEHDWKKKDRAKQDEVEQGAAAAWENPGRFSAAPMLTGPAFDTPEEAAAAVGMGPQAAPRQAIPVEKGMSADPLAPLPDAPPQGQQQAPAQLVQVRDILTGRWHNEKPEAVRDPTDADRARSVAAFYMSKGKTKEAMSFLSDFATSAVGMRNFDRMEMSDALARSYTNPTKFAETLNKGLAPFGAGVEIEAANVEDGNGGSYPALRINQQGSAAPPMWLDRYGNPSTEKPAPGEYALTAAALQRVVAGDKIGDVIAQALGFQATIQSMSIARNQESRAQRREPLELEQTRAAINNTRASTANTQANTARTIQGTGIDAAQNRRADDELYGTGAGGFGAGWTPTDVPGSPRDGGKRRHAGWDFSGMKVGTPITMPMDGEVVSQKENNGKAGNTVTVRYADGKEHTIMHLQGWHKDFKPGTKFKAGQAIAFAGNTGNASTSGTDTAVLHIQGSAGDPRRLGIPGRAQREASKDARSRLTSLRDKASSQALKLVDNPNDAQQVQRATLLALSQLVRNEPKEVQEAYERQFGVRSTLLQR